MTQQALADRLGSSLDKVKKIEAGLRVDQWLSCAEYANALGSTPNELLGFDTIELLSLEKALTPILLAYGHSHEDAESIALILKDAVAAAHTLPNDGSLELRYALAARLAVAQIR